MPGAVTLSHTIGTVNIRQDEIKVVYPCRHKDKELLSVFFSL